MVVVRYLTVVVCLFFALGWHRPAAAQRIYVLAVADTSEKSRMSFSTGPDLQYIFDAFYANVPGQQWLYYNNPLMDQADGTSRPHANPWLGPDVHADLAGLDQKILEAIERCPAGPRDTIFVYYSGHGAHDSKGHFLVMPDGTARLYRDQILSKLEQKKPRLAVLMTDSCSTQAPVGIGAGTSAMFMAPDRISPLFDNLFLKSRGVVDLNSSSEGEIAIGAIGGGLLTLAFAYMGNQPDFKPYPGPRGQPNVIPVNPPSNAAIPAVDHSAAMQDYFGVLLEHGLHGNFDPNLPPFGVLFANANQRLDWRGVTSLLARKIDVLFKSIAPRGWDTGQDRQLTQTLRIYRIADLDPAAVVEVPGRAAEARWSRPIYRPEIGDRIIEINDRPIGGTQDYVLAVKTSPTVMTFLLWEAKSGNTYRMRTRLNPPQADSRFGVAARETAGGPGVQVTRVMPGYPGTRCELAE
jgi:hypothetical protein